MTYDFEPSMIKIKWLELKGDNNVLKVKRISEYVEWWTKRGKFEREQHQEVLK